MDAFLRSLVGSSLTGGVFVLIALLLRTVFKNHLPKSFLVLLWAAVLVNLLMVFSPSSPTSVYNYVHFDFRTASWLDAAAPRPENIRAGNGEKAVVPAPSNATATARSPARRSAGMIFWLWLAGAAGLWTFFAVSYVRAAKRFSTAFLLTDDPTVNRWLAGKKRRVRVYVSDRAASPVVFGFLSPKIILPDSLDFTNAPLVRNVLEHEYVHGRLGHNGLKALVFIVAAPHWFNPLVWVYCIMFSHDLELACDERVVRAIGVENRAEYAHSLLAAAEPSRRSLPVFSAFSAKNIKERIIDIMSYKKASAPVMAVQALVVLAAFSLFGTSAVEGFAGGATAYFGGDPFLDSADAEAREHSLLAARARALAMTGGGVALKADTEIKPGDSWHEFRVVSSGREHNIVIDAATMAVRSHQSKTPGSHYATVESLPVLGMDEAERLAKLQVGGGFVNGIELEYNVLYHTFHYEVDLSLGDADYEVELEAFSGRVVKVELD